VHGTQCVASRTLRVANESYWRQATVGPFLLSNLLTLYIDAKLATSCVGASDGHCIASLTCIMHGHSSLAVVVHDALMQ